MWQKADFCSGAQLKKDVHLRWSHGFRLVERVCNAVQGPGRKSAA